jgi:hypothetical protein
MTRGIEARNGARAARIFAVAAVCAGLLGATSVAAADDQGTRYDYRPLGTRCLVAKYDTLGPSLIYAHTSWRMWAAGGSNTFRMLVKARLIPTTPGLYINRPWSQTAVGIVTNQNAPRTYFAPWVNTYAEEADAEWRVQVKLTWDRTGRRDWNKTLSFPFNRTGKCAA